jgi:hypothetical protein
MGGGIDAAGEAGDDGEVWGEFGGEVLRDPHAVGRSVAGADDADGAGGEEFYIAEDGEGGGRVRRVGEEGRVVGLAEDEEGGAVFVQGGEFALGFGAAGDSRGGGAAAGAGEIRQSGDGVGGGGEAVDQAAIGEGADGFGADEAEVVDGVVHGGSVGGKLVCCNFKLFLGADGREFSHHVTEDGGW